MKGLLVYIYGVGFTMLCFCSASIATQMLAQACSALACMMSRPAVPGWMPRMRLYLKEGVVAERRPAWRHRLHRQPSSPCSWQCGRQEAAGPGAKVRQVVCEAAQQRRAHGAHVRCDNVGIAERLRQAEGSKVKRNSGDPKRHTPAPRQAQGHPHLYQHHACCGTAPYCQPQSLTPFSWFGYSIVV